jgi:hypothetical protein
LWQIEEYSASSHGTLFAIGIIEMFSKNERVGIVTSMAFGRIKWFMDGIRKGWIAVTGHLKPGLGFPFSPKVEVIVLRLWSDGVTVDIL